MKYPKPKLTAWLFLCALVLSIWAGCSSVADESEKLLLSIAQDLIRQKMSAFPSDDLVVQWQIDSRGDAKRAIEQFIQERKISGDWEEIKMSNGVYYTVNHGRRNSIVFIEQGTSLVRWFTFKS